MINFRTARRAWSTPTVTVLVTVAAARFDPFPGDDGGLLGNLGGSL